MKPDKHKQKKSQQYKKKHGIKDDKEPKAEKTDEKSRSKKGRAPAHAQQRHTDGDQHQSKDRSNATSYHGGRENREHLTINGSESDEEIGSFRRREVTSNWEKYVGIDDLPELEEPRGADFRALLEAAGSAISQFRFADEKSWEEEELKEDSSSEISALLSIDTNELAAALDCVPLHRLLGIEEAVFSPEDVELFDQEAVMNQKLYLEARKPQDQVPGDGEPAQNKMEGLSEIWSKPDGNILDELTKDLEEATKKADPLQLISHGNHGKMQGTSVHTFDAAGLKNVENCPLNSNRIEDDLDKLLSFDEQSKNMAKEILDKSPVKKETTATSSQAANEAAEQIIKEKVEISKATSDEVTQHSQISERKIVSMTNLEDELDKLLDLDDNNGGNTKIDTEKSKIAVSAKADDLEDWLDSMLDD